MADTSCRGYLISIKSNGESGSRFPLALDSCYIGASAECEVRLLDVNVNDRHCLIKFSSGKHATIYCLCKEKPVLLNDEPINDNGSPLMNGDIIQIIDVKFKWEENDLFINMDPGRHSMNIVTKISEDNEHKRFSEPILIFNHKNVINDKEEENEHCLNHNNIDAYEKGNETKVTSETVSFTKSSISSSVETVISSYENNCTNYDAQNQEENNFSKDGNQIRRSRQFCQTYKTKIFTNTPEKKKTTPTVKSFFKNTPLQENNRPQGREVRSRYFANRKSSIRPATSLSFTETNEKAPINENEKVAANHVVNGDSVDTETENIVPRYEARVESKEITLENQMNADEITFETTVPSDIVDVPLGLVTPKCFNKAFHSTPKASELSKLELDSNLNSNEMENISDALCRPNDPTRVYNLDSNSILASPVKLAPERKKVKLEDSRIEQNSPNESRRHHTRSTSNILKRTFEECSEDNSPVGENCLTTPEKSTNECNSISRNPVIIVEQSEFDSYSPEKKVDSRKSTSSSIGSPTVESNLEASGENCETVSSLSLEMRDSIQKYDDSSPMAKCSRNLSSFSPPENNKSQEYMDSVVVSTPKKPSLMDNEEVSMSLLPTKHLAVDNATCMSTPKTPGGSPFRHRRSTGIVPCVGTPSEVYRTTKGGLTPAHKSRFNRTSMEVEVSIGPRDSLSSLAPLKFASKRSERKSTPMKNDKSVVRDSLQMHSPILEEIALEFEESQNESLNNDSQFKFVSRRRRRLAKSSFAIEDRILEESEISPSDLSNEEGGATNEEESLVPLESFDDNSEFPSTRIIVNQTATNDTKDDLNSTYNLDTPEEAVDGSKLESTTLAIKPALPKSILTPLPRQPTSVHEKSAKKVTFLNVKEDSPSSDSSRCTVTDADSEFNLQLSSSLINSTADIFNTSGGSTCNVRENGYDNEQLYMSDKSSDAYSPENNSSEMSESVVQRIVAKHNKFVKRLSSGSKKKSPRLSGVRRLFNASKSPKCNYSNVSGVEQLMKTPESLVKTVTKPSSLSKCVKKLETKKVKSLNTFVEDLKISESPNEHKKSLEFLPGNSNQTANREKVSTPSEKHARTTEALAECLSTPKALMELVNSPEFVEISKNASASVNLVNNEITESASPSHTSVVDNEGLTFTTPTMRRCSKHFRIHRSSTCHSILNETSHHDCSASLENSVVEQNEGTAENVITSPLINTKTMLKAVLTELKNKIQVFKEIQNNDDKDVLDKSINLNSEVLVSEPAPDEDITETDVRNVLKSCQSLVSAVDNNVLSVCNETDNAAAVINEVSQVSEILDSSSNASKSEFIVSLVPDSTRAAETCNSVADGIDNNKVSSDNFDSDKSKEIENSISADTANKIPDISMADESSSKISVVSKSDEVCNISCDVNLVETVSSTCDFNYSKNTSQNISHEPDPVKIHSVSMGTKTDILDSTDDISNHVTSKFQIEQCTLTKNETTVTTVDKEPQTTPESVVVEQSRTNEIPILEIDDEMPLSQNNLAIIQEATEKPQSQTDAYLSNVSESQSIKSITEAEKQESGLDQVVADSEQGGKTPKSVDTLMVNAKNKQFFDTSASFFVNEENKENLLSLSPVVCANEKSICQSSVEETEKTLPSSTTAVCDITETQLSTMIVDAVKSANTSNPFVSAEYNSKENTAVSEAKVIVEKSVSAEDEVDISLNSYSYSSNVELNTTCEENLSCVEPSLAERETMSNTETSTNLIEESRTTISYHVDEKKSADLSAESPNTSQISTESFETSINSEACLTAPSSEVSSPISNCATVAPASTCLLDSDAQIMVTPLGPTVVCVGIKKTDELTFARPKIVTQNENITTNSISTSTPISSDVVQKIMEIPQSCSTTIDPSVSPSEDEASTELLSESSETIIDDEREHTTVDSSACSDVNESKSKSETIQTNVLNKVESKTFAEPVEISCKEISSSNEVVKSQTELELLSASKEIVSAPVFEKLVEENITDDELKVAVESSEGKPTTEILNAEIPVGRSSRSFSVVLEDALSPNKLISKPSPTLLEAVTNNEITKKSPTDCENVANEIVSSRPKRGRSTKRYTDSRGESSTLSNTQTRKRANEVSPNNINVSVELQRFEMPQKEETGKGIKRKTVHFSTEPEVKRSTRSRDLGKMYIPTPKKRPTESKVNITKNVDTSPLANDSDHQFGSPCSIVLQKMGSEEEDSSVTKSFELKKPSRRRPVAQKTNVRVRPSRATTFIDNSVDKLTTESKSDDKANKVKKILHSDVSGENENQSNCEAAKEVARKQKDTTKINKIATKGRGRVEEIDSPKGEKRSKRKTVKEVILQESKTDTIANSKSGSKSRSKNVSAETVETLSGEESVGRERKTRKKAAEVVEKDTKKEVSKNKKGAASKSKNEKENSEQVSDVKSQNEIHTKKDERSKQNAYKDVVEDKNTDAAKASKRAPKSKDKNEAIEMVNESSSSLRATRQRRGVQPLVESTEPLRITKRVKDDLSAKTTIATRATRSRKDIVEMSNSNDNDGKLTGSKTSKTDVALKTSKNKPIKRSASVVIDSINEVVHKKRKQSPEHVSFPAATRITRNKNPKVVVELSVRVKRQKADEKENKPPISTKKAVKSVASAAKKKNDLSSNENVRSTRAAKMKAVSKEESSIVGVTAPTSRITRSQNAPKLPSSRSAKK